MQVIIGTNLKRNGGFFSLFFRAMANPGAKEQFLKQFENIVEGIKQNKAKVSITIHKLKSFPCLKS